MQSVWTLEAVYSCFMLCHVCIRCQLLTLLDPTSVPPGSPLPSGLGRLPSYCQRQRGSPMWHAYKPIVKWLGMPCTHAVPQVQQTVTCSSTLCTALTCMATAFLFRLANCKVSTLVQQTHKHRRETATLEAGTHPACQSQGAACMCIQQQHNRQMVNTASSR